MIATIGSIFVPKFPTSCERKFLHSFLGENRPRSLKRRDRSRRIGSGLVTDCAQLGDTVFEGRVGSINDTIFDRVI